MNGRVVVLLSGGVNDRVVKGRVNDGVVVLLSGRGLNDRVVVLLSGGVNDRGVKGRVNDGVVVLLRGG